MSKADKIFVAMCEDIINNGTTTEGQKVRPHWEDGSAAYTIKQFGVCNRYDLEAAVPCEPFLIFCSRRLPVSFLELPRT